jgi:hypothetical protein
VQAPVGRLAGGRDLHHRGSAVGRIGPSLDVALGLEGLDLAGERGRQHALGTGQLAQTDRPVVDDLAQHGEGGEADRDTGAHRDPTVEPGAAGDPPEVTQGLAEAAAGVGRVALGAHRHTSATASATDAA